MAVDDQRKDPRIQSSNLISYVSCDETDQEIMQGMGRTLNVSEGGILLETHVPIDQHHVVTLTMSYFSGDKKLRDKVRGLFQGFGEGIQCPIKNT